MYNSGRVKKSRAFLSQILSRKINTTIRERPEKILEMGRENLPRAIREYLSKMVGLELTRFLRRYPYESADVELNVRNGSYPRPLTQKK